MVKPFDPCRRADRGPLAPAGDGVKLSALWKAFADSGAVSAYIAYRLYLARVARAPIKDLGGAEAKTTA